MLNLPVPLIHKQEHRMNQPTIICVILRILLYLVYDKIK